MKIFGRDPALILAAVVLVIQNVCAFWLHVSPGTEGVIIAVATGAWGVATAFIVHDGQVAAVIGLSKALIALGLAFGVHLGADQQALAMNLVVTLLALATRTQVAAPVPDPVPSAIAPETVPVAALPAVPARA